MDGNEKCGRQVILPLFLAAFFIVAGDVPAAMSAWDFSNSSIPVDQVESGGPPRDGIPALFNPVMVPAAEADFLAGGDRVLGLEIGGEAMAFPIRILSWHELVNTVVGGKPILVNW